VVIWFRMHPVGMWCLAASSRIFLKRASPVEQETGVGSLLNFNSVSARKSFQRAFLRFVKVCSGSLGGFENQSPNCIRIGRWSEFRVCSVCQVASIVRWAVAMEMSGDEHGPLLGTRVGWSWLRILRLLEFSESVSRVPLAVAWSSSVWENQALLWALKSPTIRISSS